MHVTLVGPEFEENLSLRYLASALRGAGHTASLARFDSPEYTDGVVAQVLRERPGIVGLSMVFQVRAREFFDLARALRRAGYAGHMTAGGHFATFACEPILGAVPEIDSIVRQEGEQTLVELAGALERGAPEVARIPGLAMRGADGAILLSARRQQVQELDSLPFPARDTPPERHLGIPTAFLVGSRGCYADCDYCSIFAWHEAAVGKRYRLRSPANIAEEMAFLYHERGVRFFVFHDDNFFLPKADGNRKRFLSLRDEIDRRGIRDIGLMLKLRPNDCDPDNLALLQEMGLLRVFVGIENASQRQLRTLGRDSTIGDVRACLELLRDRGVYGTYNLLLFDPYTTLDDIRLNLRFMREVNWFPFNWCKVEPYAGTALERRYLAEGRLRGDYLGYDYEMDDPRVRLLYDLLLPAFYYRNYDYYGLANQNIGLGYHRQLLRHFYPGRCTPVLDRRVQTVIEAVNGSAVDLLDEALRFVATARLDDRKAIDRFGTELKRESFRRHHALAAKVETVMREIELAADVATAAGAGISEAFTPLLPPAEHRTPNTDRRPSNPQRRRALAALGGGAMLALAACSRKETSIPPNPPMLSVSAPQASLRVAAGYASEVEADGVFVLEGVVQPGDGKVEGEPRISTSGGRILKVSPSPDRRAVLIEYQPSGGSAHYDPNVTVTAAWTVRRRDNDMVVVARAFVHARDDGSYAYGYETPRPTISEMAAPPIYQGPRP